MFTANRILFTGDFWCHPLAGMTPLLEAQLRFTSPSAPWRFWHLGDESCTIRQLTDEAMRRLLGCDAQRVLVSIGHASADSSGSPRLESDTAALLEVLSDKLPDRCWMLLPAPSLWSSARRGTCLRLRESLLTGFPKLHRIDLEAEAQRFLSSQDPEHAIPLTRPGPVPTPAGALLTARIIASAWDS